MLSAMKFITIAAILVGFASAQTQVALPECAQGCVTQLTSGSSIGTCSSIDVKCICSNDSFLDDIACCLADVCSAADQTISVQFALDLCKTVGVTDLPTTVVCKTAAAPSPTPSPTPTPSSSSASTDMPMSSAMALSSDTFSSTSSSTSSTATSSPTATAIEPATTTNSSASHSFDGMGVMVIGGLAMVVMALL